MEISLHVRGQYTIRAVKGRPWPLGLRHSSIILAGIRALRLEYKVAFLKIGSESLLELSFEGHEVARLQKPDADASFSTRLIT